ncbi:MAG: ABC transporter permease [Candidatus Humimicrobiaceae bacterium]|jgi:multidrug/hemolysin transport system permease protein|nr:ABC transporter permease [Candidatus Humimicrobiaceae bacterium]
MVIVNLIKRNLKLFFRDKASVFFSLLAVFIIIGLYVFFLGRMMTEGFENLLGDNARFIVDSWVMAGILSVTSITTTMGALGIMVDDRSKKILNDFYSAPLKRSYLTCGYLLSCFIIGIIMTIIALVIAEIYIISGGGELLGLMSLLKLLGVMFISVFAGSSMVFFIVTFFKSSNAFAAASTVIGTLIGFLTGIYIPIGQLPSGVQTAIKIFPISHSAALFRQIMMEAPMSEALAGAPVEVITDFKKTMGVIFFAGDKEITPLINILVLVATGVIFLILSIVNISIKKR